MGAYQYQALKASGTTCKGVIEADSLRNARELLREQGFIPIQVAALKSSRLSKQSIALSAEELSLFTRQLATLLAAGIPVEESLRGVSEQAEKNKVRQLVMGVRAKVMEGHALADALSEYPRTFRELYRSTVGAGEQTGHLDNVLVKLADYTENQQQMRQKIQQALIYPLLMILVSTGIISFLLAFVVPKIIDVFASSGQSLPMMTTILIAISSSVKSYGLYIIALLILLLVGFKHSLKKERVRRTFHSVLLKMPICAYLIRSINVARYIHTFGILFAAGVSVLETMRVSASLLSNLVMREAFLLAALRVREGTSISIALKDTHFLSPMAVHLIASGEKSGQLSQMMDRAALYLDNDVRRLIETALTLLEPLVILFMGGVVLFIVLATLLPIFSMEQLVN